MAKTDNTLAASLPAAPGRRRPCSTLPASPSREATRTAPRGGPGGLTGERFERPGSFSVSEHFAAGLREQANTPPFTAVQLQGQPSAIATLWDRHYLRHCRVERSRLEATFRLAELAESCAPESS